MTTEQFILLHRTADVRQLALQGPRHPGVDMPFALRQIAGWQTARRKLPTWAACEGVEYPPHLNMEQCSSEPAARYKARLARRWAAMAAAPGETASMADLTGGFGVDFSFVSRGFGEATYVERDEALCRIVGANLPRLGVRNATVCCADCAAALRSMPPRRVEKEHGARRDEHGGRTVLLSDCTPDVCRLLPQLMQKSRFVMLKLSPMLDWHKAAADLGPCVRQVHIVSVGGECKELLLVLSASVETGKPLRVACVDVSAKPSADGSYAETVFEYDEGEAGKGLVLETEDVEPSAGDVSKAEILNPNAEIQDSKFLYEPNASVMKAGCFAQLSRRFGVQAVAPNSHLFLSGGLVEGFPGRRFAVKAVSTMNKKQLRQALQGVAQANVAVRNFPLTADALRRRLKLKDGGNTYIFATTTAQGDHVLMLCEKA